jgi:hypothetical protein
MGLCAVFTLLYPIGMPLFFGRMLYRYRNRLWEPGVQLELGFLYAAFTRQMYMFELIDVRTAARAALPFPLCLSFACERVLIFISLVCWWVGVQMANKLFLTSILAFLPNGYQMPIGTAVLAFRQSWL